MILLSQMTNTYSFLSHFITTSLSLSYSRESGKQHYVSGEPIAVTVMLAIVLRKHAEIQAVQCDTISSLSTSFFAPKIGATHGVKGLWLASVVAGLRRDTERECERSSERAQEKVRCVSVCVFFCECVWKDQQLVGWI